MKKNLLYLLMLPLAFMLSCSSDDEPDPTHEMGNWALDSFVLINFPEAFSSNEGLIATIDAITFGGATIESYSLSLNTDNTFARSIEVLGPNINDSGTWELSGDDLTLTNEDGDDLEFTVELNEDDQLWLSEPAAFLFIPDVYFDTVTQDYFDLLETFSDEQLDSVNDVLSQEVQLDLVYAFERQ